MASQARPLIDRAGRSSATRAARAGLIRGQTAYVVAEDISRHGARTRNADWKTVEVHVRDYAV
jgi:hypothetical protein